ncbi:MAG: hypothetical protein WBV39_12975, partial [Rudaea sp.]
MIGFLRQSVTASLLALSLSAATSSAIAAPNAAQAARHAHAQTPAEVFKHTVAMNGLLPVHVDAHKGRILITLPAAQADGVSARYLYTTALRT